MTDEDPDALLSPADVRRLYHLAKMIDAWLYVEYTGDVCVDFVGDPVNQHLGNKDSGWASVRLEGGAAVSHTDDYARWLAPARTIRRAWFYLPAFDSRLTVAEAEAVAALRAAPRTES